MTLLTRLKRTLLRHRDDPEPSRLRVVPTLEAPPEEALQEDRETHFGPERRINPRFRISNRANVVSWGRKYRARIVDISRTGAAITARAHMRVGEKAVLTVHDMGRYRGTVLRHIGDGVAIRFDETEERPTFDETAIRAKSDAVRATLDKRRFMRASTSASASMITGGERFSCSLLDLSAGGTAIQVQAKPDLARTVILYIEQLGRMRGRITRHFAEGIAIEFDVEPSRRDRLAQQVLGLLGRKTA
jgi:hypothetical protein